MSAFDLSAVAARSGQTPALIMEGRVVTFSELQDHQRRSMSAAARSTSLVAFIARPHLEALSFATRMLSAGVAMLPLHPRMTSSEVASVLLRFPNAMYVTDDELGWRAECVESNDPAPPDDERLSAILLSSGTTGEPKGIRLSRRAFAASARASEKNLGWVDDDRWLLAMPFSHAGGLSILTRTLAAGRSVVVHPSFDPDRVIRSVDREGVTLLSVVPTMLRALLERDDGSLKKLRAVLVGGASCPPELLDSCRERAIPALTTYGLTEACSQVTTQSLARPDLRTSFDSGMPIDGARVRVVNGLGIDVVGEEGSVLVGGDMLMTGYVGAPDLARGTSIATGDRGVIDDRGRLTITGRADDLIITGGENVSPIEVERALVKIAGVREALVVGIPDARWGQVVGALLVVETDRSVEEILTDLRREVSPHKVPRRLVTVSALPLGGTGKPDRRAARALIESNR